LYGYVLGDGVNFVDPSGLAGASIALGGSVGYHLGLAGGNISTGGGIGTSGAFSFTTICFRVGFGYGLFGGGVGNVGLDPFPSSSDCPNDDCSITWSIGLGGDLGTGNSQGASAGIGNGGISGVGALKAGAGIGFSVGVEICVTESCPL
jgi:hypothetical protein